MGMGDFSVIRMLSPVVSHTSKPSFTPVSRTRSGGGDSSGIQADNISIGREGSVTPTSVSSPNKNSSTDINAVIEDLNQKLEVAHNTLRFQIDETTEEIKVQVVNKETGQVVRTIPPEPSLSLLAQGEFNSLLSIHG
jgi:uncharacterized FlaG/YvyC family protein